MAAAREKIRQRQQLEKELDMAQAQAKAKRAVNRTGMNDSSYTELLIQLTH